MPTKLRISFFLILFSLSACKPTLDLTYLLSHTISIKSATFNIKWDDPNLDTHLLWPNRKSRLIETIKAMNIDVIGLQEVTHNQLLDIDSGLADFNWSGIGRDGGEAGEYSPIFYNKNKYNLLDEGTFWYSDTPDELSIGGPNWGNPSLRRVCSWVKLLPKASSKAFYVYNTHWHHTSDEGGQLFRYKAAQLVVEKIQEISPNQPFLLMGDFNAQSDQKPMQYLLGKETNDDGCLSSLELVDHFHILHPNATTGTFNGWTNTVEGQRRIDFIFSDKATLVKESSIYNTNWDLVSDHHPVYSEALLCFN
jgi:endonuclease/exonuclease/phosphatase family metal-dependent hydrolase